MAPFCEECRFNFLTNTATSYTPLAPPRPPGLNLPPGFQSQPGPPAPPPPHQQPPPHQGPPPGPPPHQGPPAPPQQRDPFEYQGSRPSQMNRPAEPLGQDQSGPQLPPQAFQQGGPPPPSPAFQQSGPPAPPAPPKPQHTGGGDDWMLSPPSRTQSPPPPAPPASQSPQATQGPQTPQGQPQGPAPFQQQGGQFPGGPAPAGWTAVIGPDRAYFMAMMQRSGPEANGLNLPAYSPEQRLPLTGTQVTIGRRRHSTGESPGIDLSVPPEDPGVSHQHAVLVQQPDGSWAVVDQNSTNGTTLNGAEDPIQPYVPVPLNDGDRVHVGAWTTITLRRA